MGKIIESSELVINDDGSVYHLHLLPEDIAETIILVGDPERVPQVAKHFDKTEVIKSKREFVTHTGWIGTKRISVISTGIGTDNIDIVLNELDALANIDLVNRQVKDKLKSLKIIRIGTSGSLQEDVPIDSLLVSSYGLGLDVLMNYYDYEQDDTTENLLSEIDDQLNLLFITPYLFKAPGNLLEQFTSTFASGITATCPGFYAPQGRILRGEARFADILNRLQETEIHPHRITNFEMETAGIYGLATLLGHEAISVNAILANRVKQTFSKTPTETVERAIVNTLRVISEIQD